MKKVDHIGVAVRSIEEALPFYESVLGIPLLKVEEVANQGVKVAFLDAGNLKIELLEPISDQSPVSGFIEKRGEGLHHIAFSVETIEERIQELKEKGVRMIDDNPKTGAGGASVAFLHPKSSMGVLYELCEKKASKGEKT
ncbi:methylmalonyl-CoA epimerase [Rossellomorea marisflavi]|jgi:methylmalonyl-CoA/ethylmalonyl-CoA epimerase|uniref:methylmalonyl-CoA epimerase n=1 Tax=Rossellomorea marisflavi TaxID=189381 RepID=UPI0028532152|nr:methylmalonyl-CoA epimerase [Rossellomorea marisflavi]MDR4936395.1 methylmalonyl-CoA epimerase [Rossellomorea marisflavi]